VNRDNQDLNRQFFAMIRNLKGWGNDIIEVRKFFEIVSGIKGYTPPTVEYMTILKNYKPLLFYEFKNSLVPNTSMHMLAIVHFNLGEAIISLGITSEDELRNALKGKTS
jgi:hypothetical protein